MDIKKVVLIIAVVVAIIWLGFDDEIMGFIGDVLGNLQGIGDR
jgi:hypothetical protein